MGRKRRSARQEIRSKDTSRPAGEVCQTGRDDVELICSGLSFKTSQSSFKFFNALIFFAPARHAAW